MMQGDKIKIGEDFKMPVRAKTYVKRPMPVKAIQINSDFILEINNKKISGFAGDYIVCSLEGTLGRIDRASFEEMYETLSIGRR